MSEERYAENIRIRSYETDINGNLRIEQAMRLMEEVGAQQMSFVGLSYDDVVASGKTLLVNRVDTILYRNIKKHESVSISSWACKPSSMVLPRRYRIADSNNETVCDMIIQWTVVDIEKKKILRPNSIDFSMFNLEDLDIKLPKRDKFTKNEMLEPIDKIKVSYNEIDSNGHVNNVNYLRIVQNHIPELLENWRIKRFKINYAKEALYGEEITVLGSEPTEILVSEINPERKKVYKFRFLKESGLLSAEAAIELVQE